ncbi:hypothetical protein [Lacticaseibacillus sp. GG6-2]
MKRFLLVSVGIALSFGLVACGESGNSSEVSSLKSENSSLKSANSSLKKSLNKPDEITKAKTLNTVGEAQYTIISVTQERVKQAESNYTDAEYNYSGIKSYPDHYYRAEIQYQLKNVGKKDFDLSYMGNSVTDANGMKYSFGGGATFGFDDNDNGVLKAGDSTSGSFYLLSKTKIDLSHFKVNVTDQIIDAGSDNQATVGNAGTAAY